MQLIDDEQEWNPTCEKALLDIFKSFDEDKDGCLNDKELDAFAIATNGTKVFHATNEPICH
jgi:hypothetical protein